MVSLGDELRCKSVRRIRQECNLLLENNSQTCRYHISACITWLRHTAIWTSEILKKSQALFPLYCQFYSEEKSHTENLIDVDPLGTPHTSTLSSTF